MTTSDSYTIIAEQKDEGWIVKADSYKDFFVDKLIRACPFCASTYLTILLEAHLYTVTCDECNCMGPEDLTLLTAIQKWNGQGF